MNRVKQDGQSTRRGVSGFSGRRGEIEENGMDFQPFVAWRRQTFESMAGILNPLHPSAVVAEDRPSHHGGQA